MSPRKTTPRRKAVKTPAPHLEGALRDVLREELRVAATQPIRTLLPPARARRLVRDFAPEALDDRGLAEIILRVRQQVEKQLRSTRRTPAEILGADVGGAIDRLFEADLLPEEVADDVIAAILRQEYMRKLLTEVVHTSIVSFYKRVNPLFGGLATKVLDEQIRGFINLFMPMIQEQAVRFAVGRRNQDFARDLARALTAHVLDTRTSDLFPPLGARQRKAIEGIVRDAAASKTLRATGHRGAVMLWDSIYEALRDRRLGDLIDLEPLLDPLADAGAELLAAILARPAIAAVVREQAAPPAARPANQPAARGRARSTRAARDSEPPRRARKRPVK